MYYLFIIYYKNVLKLLVYEIYAQLILLSIIWLINVIDY